VAKLLLLHSADFSNHASFLLGMSAKLKYFSSFLLEHDHIFVHAVVAASSDGTKAWDILKEKYFNIYLVFLQCMIIQ
jgi:hypothetical protein